MGRPLNKKYFGNTNDPQIGGEGIASFTIGGTNNNYIAIPTVSSIGAPNLPTGVQATSSTVRMVVKSVAIENGGGSYLDEELVELGDGSLANGDGTVDGTYTTRASFRIKSVDGGGAATTIELVNGGSYTVLAYNGSTHASAAGSTVTAMYTTGGTGNNLRVTITWGILSIEVGTAGSGYTSAPSVTLSGGNGTATAVLASAKVNAVTITGRVVAGSTVALDVIKQTGSRRYLVTDGTNTGVVELQSAAVDAAGEAQIVATDSVGGTYYVTKLTAHRAVVTRGTGTQFATGDSVPWVLDTAVLNTSVKIPNA